MQHIFFSFWYEKGKIIRMDFFCYVFEDISMLLYPSALNANVVDFELNSATCIQITSGSE